MLLQNANTNSGLVNGITGSTEEAILDKDIQGNKRKLPFYFTINSLNG